MVERPRSPFINDWTPIAPPNRQTIANATDICINSDLLPGIFLAKNDIMRMSNPMMTGINAVGLARFPAWTELIKKNSIPRSIRRSAITMVYFGISKDSVTRKMKKRRGLKFSMMVRDDTVLWSVRQAWYPREKNHLNWYRTVMIVIGWAIHRSVWVRGSLTGTILLCLCQLCGCFV